MSKIIEPKILKGFRDFLPDAESQKKRIQHILEQTFEACGFVPIDTPILEYTEVLLGKGGGETDKQLYRFYDKGNRDVSMRFDLTVPFARFMAGHVDELYLPFKRYHIAKVFRGENTQRGRYREFTQCDFDIVGVDSASADFETIHLMKKSFQALGIESIRIHLSHRGVFNRFLEKLDIKEHSASILRTVDKLSKVGKNEVKNQLRFHISSHNAEEILQFIQPEKTYAQTLEKMKEFAGGEAEDTERLTKIYQIAKKLDFENTFFLDPSITRGLDYYTGVIFETFLDDLPDIGSVCSGGRYNNLASLYTKQQIPGVGSSIGLDRLMAALQELSSIPAEEAAPDILIFCLDEKYLGDYHSYAETLRNNQLSAEVYPYKKKLGQQFGYAEKKGIPLGLICGEDEISENVVNLKNLNTRENYNSLSLQEFIEKAKGILNS